MKAQYQLVDVSSITCETPRSTFNEAYINEIAEGILAVGMLLQPLLLRVTGIDEYEVIETSALAYWGAVKAKELAPREAEMVSSIVLPKGLIDDAIHQVESLN